MKAILLTASFFLIFGIFIKAQNVGVGTQTPTEKLNVDTGHIKVGQAIWATDANDRFIKFGDGDFVSIGEADFDDFMRLTARKFTFTHLGSAFVPFVEIQGSVMIADGSQGLGKVLTSDADGNASWQLPANSNSAFRANFAGSVPVSEPCVGCLPLQIITWSSEQYDEGSDLSGSAFTATKAGLYHFDVNLTFAVSGVTGTAGAYVGVLVYLPGGKEKYVYTPVSPANNGGRVTASASWDLKMASGEMITVAAIHNIATAQSVMAEISTNKEASSFSGHRVY